MYKHDSLGNDDEDYNVEEDEDNVEYDDEKEVERNNKTVNTTFCNPSQLVEAILYDCELCDYKAATQTQVQNHKSSDHPLSAAFAQI